MGDNHMPQRKHGNKLGRRELLKAATAAAVGAALNPKLTAAAKAVAQGDGLIARENAKTGTSDWQLTYVRPEKSTGSYRTKLIEGYCSHTSIRPGEALTFHLSADPASKVTIDI